jgi:ribosomal protein S18 acetylase RimI-like enzyme
MAGYVLAPGGGWATLYWFARALTGLDVYYVLAGTTRDVDRPNRSLPSAFNLLTIFDERDFFGLDSRAQELVDARTGMGVSSLLARGNRLYVLVEGTDPVCQLSIYHGPSVDVDTPGQLRFAFGPDKAFLAYLYTHARHRRRGTASLLLPLVAQDLRARGIEHILAHVGATNVPSLNTFSRSGWKIVGKFVANRHGRLAHVSSGLDGLSISPIPDAERSTRQA